MDARDRKLLYLLDINSRQKESVLAKELITSKQVINYRIKRFQNECITKQFQTVLNLSVVGIPIYAQVYCKLLDCTKEKENEIINYLVNHPCVGYVGLLGGRFDFSIVLIAKTIAELEKDLYDIVSKYPRELRQYLISLRTSGARFPRKYLLEKPSNENAKAVFTKESKVETLDELDKKILALLVKDSRLSIVDISEKLKVPFSTIRIRIKSLEKRKIISGYSLLIDLNKIGLQTYKIFIKVNDKSKEIGEKLRSFAAKHPAITWFLKTLGDHDYELRIDVESQEKYQEVIREIRSDFSSVIEEMETLMIFKELKEDYTVVLNKI